MWGNEKFYTVLRGTALTQCRHIENNLAIFSKHRRHTLYAPNSHSWVYTPVMLFTDVPEDMYNDALQSILW